MKYRGHLSRTDPLYEYLRNDILPQLTARCDSPDFRVSMFRASNHVYLYEDHLSRTRMIGKFFGGVSDRPPETAFRRMEREFNNLSHLRRIGLADYPHYVARPLGSNASLNCVLVEEFCYGTPLNDFIVRAIREGARENLFEKLTALAYFLATLHNRTSTGERVDVNRDCSYFDRIMDQLKAGSESRPSSSNPTRGRNPMRRQRPTTSPAGSRVS
jgi:hypothetical protein